MKVRHYAWLTLAVGGVAIAMAARTAGALTINGMTTDTDFIVKNDRTYVPLADVAKAMKLSIKKTDNGYDLEPAGGANQVQGVNSKVGDTINLGYATVKAVKVVRTEKYSKQFGSGDVTPSGDNQIIVAVVMRVKNATDKKMYLDVFGTDHTALTDKDEHTYIPFTGMGADVVNANPEMLPGSAQDFALVFSVPKSAEIQDLVYGLRFNFTKYPPKDLRISLKETQG